MSVLVVTDSAATIPPALAAALGIAVVPLRVTVDGGTVPDGTLGDLELVASAGRVTTSGPSVGEFVRVLEERAGDAGAVILTVSHDMGASTFLAARAAAGEAAVPVRVMDTATAAGGQGLVVLAAARAAADGAELDRVEAVAREAASRVRLVATLRDLDHLARSGHVPEAAAWAGRWIGLRPVIELRDGRVRPMRPALSGPAARDRVLDAWRGSRPPGPAALHVAALHALDEEGARDLLDRVRSELEPAEAFVGSFGTGMVVHSGPGVLGLAWWWEDGPEG